MVGSVASRFSELCIFIKRLEMVGGAIVGWLEHQTLNREDRGLNPLAAVSKLGFVHPTLPQFTSLYYIYTYGTTLGFIQELLQNVGLSEPACQMQHSEAPLSAAITHIIKMSTSSEVVGTWDSQSRR